MLCATALVGIASSIVSTLDNRRACRLIGSSLASVSLLRNLLREPPAAQLWTRIHVLLPPGPAEEAPAYKASLTHSEGTYRRLTEIVRVEQHCCAFLNIALHASDDVRRFSSEAPVEAAPVVQEPVAVFESGSSRGHATSAGLRGLRTGSGELSYAWDSGRPLPPYTTLGLRRRRGEWVHELWADPLTSSAALAEDDVMDAVSSLRVMTDSMAAYDEGDFDRLAQLYAEDITWSSPWRGNSCQDRNDVFELFRWRRAGKGDLSIDEIRGLPGRVYVRGRVWPGGEPIFTVFAIAEGKIIAAKDFASREQAEATFVSRPESA